MFKILKYNEIYSWKCKTNPRVTQRHVSIAARSSLRFPPTKENSCDVFGEYYYPIQHRSFIRFDCFNYLGQVLIYSSLIVQKITTGNSTRYEGVFFLGPEKNLVATTSQLTFKRISFLFSALIIGQTVYSLGPVQKVDNAVQRISPYPLDNAIGFPYTYLLERAIKALNNWGQYIRVIREKLVSGA